MTEQTNETVLADLIDGVQSAVRAIASEGNAAGTPRVEFTRPSEAKFGDYATNVALLLAPLVGDNPRVIGTRIAEAAAALPGVERAEVAGPGFVNLTLSDDWFADTLAGVLAAGDRFGSGVAGQPERINLEFVSANPTGQMNVANGRHAAFGDSLARILRFAGHDVQTEYYVNDFGNQVELFGQSIMARATGGEVPSEGYGGPEIAELAQELGAQEGDDPREVGLRGVDAMVARMQPALEGMRVHFDRFQSERELQADGTVERALEQIRSIGQTYEHDGATFLRTTAYGDDKDRAIVRSNGVPTYFASDIGYLAHKYGRGIDRAMLVLGADHHGYMARLKGATQALGYRSDQTEIIIMQMVQLLEGGEQKRMSKRRGDVVLLSDFLDQIGVDAARFFLVQRSNDQSLDIDLDLAQEAASTNPVYYVQYAHARICSIVRTVAEKVGVELDAAVAEFDADRVRPETLHASERRLIKRIAEFPEVVREAAARRQPHRLTVYAQELASDFSGFYRDCYVTGDGVTAGETTFRLALCGATRTVLAQALDLVGVGAPESM